MFDNFNSDMFTVNYPTLFFFQVGEWWDYLALVLVVAGLAACAWFAQRNKWFALFIFIAFPLVMTFAYWNHSTKGTSSEGWFQWVKLYSALVGSLSLVALQYFKKLQTSRWYLFLPPLLLAVNIIEAVIRDFQCFSMTGTDPVSGNWIAGGPWNIMNGVAGILNILAISGWAGIYIAKGKNKAVVWADLTIPWIIAYDLWNFAYLYNCLSDHAWYSGLGLLLSCTIPVFFAFGRGSWIQYRAYTLYLWCAFAFTFPHFMEGKAEHLSSRNPYALFLVSLVALLANISLVIWHFYKVYTTRRNPFTQEVYFDTPYAVNLMKETASDEELERISTRLDVPTEKLLENPKEKELVNSDSEGSSA